MNFLRGLFRKSKTESIALAVMAIGERDGSTRFMGEDSTGKSFNLKEINQSALLFVPRDTLPHLQADRELWRKVDNGEFRVSVVDDYRYAKMYVQMGFDFEKMASDFLGRI